MAAAATMAQQSAMALQLQFLKIFVQHSCIACTAHTADTCKLQQQQMATNSKGCCCAIHTLKHTHRTATSVRLVRTHTGICTVRTRDKDHAGIMFGLIGYKLGLVHLSGASRGWVCQST